MSNRLAELMKTGQSVWFDNLTRGMIERGDIRRMIEEDDLRGMTSNPTIFEKAINGSGDYDAQLQELSLAGADAQGVYEGLVLADIGRAADILLPVYERTGGLDGYISLEVDPRLAGDTQATIDEAARLFARLARPNVMIKIPASREGIPAIEEVIRRGINVNITMIFSIENYEQVAEAFIRGLERRADEGQSVQNVASVASFFVSRVDTVIDQQLEKLVADAQSEEEKNRYTSLLGLAGIANAKLAYARYREIFHSERFARLRALGAQTQRPLWASTGTKNPNYRDVLYVEQLIGPETVNTIPPQTYAAFLDHGKVAPTLEQGLDDARAHFARLAEVGIDLKAVTERLQVEGLRMFVESFDNLMSSTGARRAVFVAGVNDRLSVALVGLEGAYDSTLAGFAEQEVAQRVWAKDPTVWKPAGEAAHHENIQNSLGWLGVVGQMRGATDELRSFAEEVRGAGFSHVMLCGMGGSSLAPEVLRQVFGPQDGWPELLVLDSTDPDVLHDFAARIDPARCLFVIASKSGTTTEVKAFHQFWFQQVGQHVERPGLNFVAVTDPGTALDTEARAQGFRRVFLNPADIGGRFSALSYFGLVPAALMGLDVTTLLERASQAVAACGPDSPLTENPGARLGALIGVAALAGRDKLTLVADERLASFGLWAEQLVAESTGKEGKGVVPVAGEPLADPELYGDDRLFVSISVGEVDSEVDARLKSLEAVGHPVVRRVLRDSYDLGEEFFLWEAATAFAGHVLGINPFDQPNVQESKDKTREVLAAYARDGRLPQQTLLVNDGQVSVYADTGASTGLPPADGAAALRTHLARAQANEYVALLAYFEETPEVTQLLAAIRAAVLDSTRLATTVGYGPRFLHSTGQLHKGGPDTGLFVQLTAADAHDFEVPGEGYTFGTLKEAQALGDFAALAAHKRRVLRFDLGTDAAQGLRHILAAIKTEAPETADSVRAGGD